MKSISTLIVSSIFLLSPAGCNLLFAESQLGKEEVLEIYQSAKDSILINGSWSREMVKKGLLISLRDQFAEGIRRGYAMYPLRFDGASQADSIQYYADLAIKLSLPEQDDESLMFAYANLGRMYEGKEMLNKALEAFLTSIDYGEKGNDERELAQLYLGVAWIFYQLEHWVKSSEYSLRALDISRKKNDPYLMSMAYYRLFHIVNDDPDYQLEADRYLRSYDSIAHALNHPEMISYSYENHAYYHQYRGTLDSARYYFEKALGPSTEGVQQDEDLLLSICDLAEAEFQLGHIEKAREYFLQYDSLRKNIQDDFSTVRCLQVWAQIEMQLGNSEKAYHLLSESIEADNRFYDDEVRNEAFDYEAKYQRLQQEAEIERQQFEIDRKTFQRNVVYFGSGIIFLIGMLVFHYYRGRQYVKELVSDRLLLKKDNKLIESQMQMMRSQMNPHFLFNSLNSIKHVILSRPKEEAAKYISQFSKLMRLNLQNSAEKLITLDMEVSFLKQYLGLEQKRFSEPFDVVWNIDPEIDIEDHYVPPMLIQPYVENAIWHGLRYRKEKGTIEMSISQNPDDELLFVIEDNGVGREKAGLIRNRTVSLNKSMGTKITEERIQMTNVLHQSDIRVFTEDLYNKNGIGTGTRVTLIIPSLSPKHLEDEIIYSNDNR